MPLQPIEQRLVERFMRYSAISSQSNPNNLGKCLPSSPGQQLLADLLAKELRAAGLQNVVCDTHATVTAVKPGNVPGAPRIGFICHLDTFDCGLSPVVKAQKIHYEGGDVCLNKEKDIWMRAKEHPVLGKYVDQDILFSDGTSVLGADDKAAITSVMDMIVHLDSSKEQHGDIVICFVPDEEIGLVGAKKLDVKGRFNVDFAYTLDCCELGEVVYECFNAATAEIKFTGVAAHPMSAKGVLVNPLLMAVSYISHFSREETPECTELREGYWWFSKMTANSMEAHLQAMVRDHDLETFNRRKLRMLEVAKAVQAMYPTGKVEIKIEDVYANIANSIKEDHTAIELLLEALEKAKVKPKITLMRGGTDGAALSAQGLLTPNFFTGAHNFHSPYEFLPIPSFVKAREVCHNIVVLGAGKRKRAVSSL
ncbi:peptidase t putative peptidase T putative metallo-peptidase ClanMH family M20B [Leptomonas seymouri]|uniref:Peptidase t putative peptidase T putative metallo-peptidase ClanMH family M20B n=1 Tax=Leptomonas seymouri TaxID=5684 RepID=A0A0N1PDB0_LEPSE|nr:peptidase t putative peptidase T putative metallo-peptidase ClanMH family M20B [Leptomonas seymouri]|eukprot:KPI85291.1 peptidase t putative peptidase T putative metallo-peptidase ClanMH family M20B [Leptomonas seymouri]